MPVQGMQGAVQPSQVVSTNYPISIENPTIVGLVSGDIVIFACRDSNCKDYSQATYLSKPANISFGPSIAVTLNKESYLSILYTRQNTTLGGAMADLYLDTCRDPLCAIPGTSTKIGSVKVQSTLWLGYDVNHNVPIVLVSDATTPSLDVYSCSSASQCTHSGVLLHQALISFTLLPFQKGTQTLSWALIYSTQVSVNPDSYAIFSQTCTSNLTQCTQLQHLSMVPQSSTPITSVAATANSSNVFNLAYTSTLAHPNGTAHSIVLSLAQCVPTTNCTLLVSNTSALSFTPASTGFQLTAAIATTQDEPIITYAVAQAANPWSLDYAASDVIGLTAYSYGSKPFFGPILGSSAQPSTYHKPPPKILIPIFVIAGIALVSTIAVIVWRVFAGKPVKPGYEPINS